MCRTQNQMPKPAPPMFTSICAPLPLLPSLHKDGVTFRLCPYVADAWQAAFTVHRPCPTLPPPTPPLHHIPLSASIQAGQHRQPCPTW